jgi:membrane associated rhomboid family serine protease
MTFALITINVLVLGFEDILAETDIRQLVEFLYQYGSVPGLILDGRGGGALTSLTSTFLHAGLFHLAGNMIMLWAFGRRVEDACGPWRFLLFYLLCGVLADITSTLIHASSFSPSIGASGAVFGVMGAYLLLFPGGRIRTLLLLLFIPLVPRLRAFWIILYFFLSQLLSVYQVLAFDVAYNVNYWAHLGGFFGSLFIFFFLNPEALHRYRLNLPV